MTLSDICYVISSIVCNFPLFAIAHWLSLPIVCHTTLFVFPIVCISTLFAFPIACHSPLFLIADCLLFSSICSSPFSIFIVWHIPFFVIHYYLSFVITCHHLLSVIPPFSFIPYCLSFPIVIHPHQNCPIGYVPCSITMNFKTIGMGTLDLEQYKLEGKNNQSHDLWWPIRMQHVKTNTRTILNNGSLYRWHTLILFRTMGHCMSWMGIKQWVFLKQYFNLGPEKYISYCLLGKQPLSFPIHYNLSIKNIFILPIQFGFTDNNLAIYA